MSKIFDHAEMLSAALQSVLQHCVTVNGMPDKGKGRTADQQTAFDAARAALAAWERHNETTKERT